MKLLIMNDFKVICFKLAFLLMTAKFLICFNSSADVGVLSCCHSLIARNRVMKDDLWWISYSGLWLVMKQT